MYRHTNFVYGDDENVLRRSRKGTSLMFVQHISGKCVHCMIFFCFDNNGCSLFQPHGMAMVNSNWKLFEYRVWTLTFKEFFGGQKCHTIWKFIYLLHFYWTVSHHFMGPPIPKSSSATVRYTRLAEKMRFLYKYIKTKLWLATENMPGSDFKVKFLADQTLENINADSIFPPLTRYVAILIAG